MHLSTRRLRALGMILLCTADVMFAGCKWAGEASGGDSSGSSSSSSTGSSSSSSSISSSSSSSSSSSTSSSSVGSAPVPSLPTDHVTFQHDLGRTGLNATEVLLTPANVNSSSFGVRQRLTVSGSVDAQPLYLSQLAVGGVAHNTVFAATENDVVYAFDVDSGLQLWMKSMLGTGESPSDADQGCNQVGSAIGVTSTPVIDRSRGEIFVVAMSKDASNVTHQRLHALDLTTGAEMAGSPVEISATAGTRTFDPHQYEERAALLLVNGTIYTSWTSHCDNGPYGGWVIAYDEATLARTAVLNLAASSDAGPAIWMAGNGPAADAAGNVYLLTANGAFETVLDGSGFPGGGDYGNSIMKLSTAGGGLSVADYFSPHDTVSLSDGDLDLGSGGLLLLPDVKDATGATRHLVAGSGKTAVIYLGDRDNLGKFNSSKDNIWQALSGQLGGAVFSSPAYFNGTLYYCASNSACKALPLSGAKLGNATSASLASFRYPGATPAVSANGTGNAIVWAHENSSPAVLHAYDAADLTHELYNSSQAGSRDQFGAGNKFITPAIADGRVFVGGHAVVAVFGLLQ